MLQKKLPHALPPHDILPFIMFSSDKKKATAFDYEGGDLEAMMVADKYYQWIIDTVRPYIGHHIAEVGAGVGSFSKLLKATEPKTLTLIEPSKRTHALLKKNIPSDKKTTVTTINNYLTGQESKLKGKIDTFVYINVFEHIEDDHAEMRRIADILQKGGHVIIFVPALRGLYSEFDKNIGHYRRYNKTRLQSLCDAAGLELVKTRYMDMIGMLPWYASFVLLRRKALQPGLVKIYDRLAVPLIRKVESTVEAPIGKNILLIAKKR
jgi:SAM-dependent methyltransferase